MLFGAHSAFRWLRRRHCQIYSAEGQYNCARSGKMFMTRLHSAHFSCHRLHRLGDVIQIFSLDMCRVVCCVQSRAIRGDGGMVSTANKIQKVIPEANFIANANETKQSFTYQCIVTNVMAITQMSTARKYSSIRSFVFVLSVFV